MTRRGRPVGVFAVAIDLAGSLITTNERRDRLGRAVGQYGVVERTFAWLTQLRRLRVRYDKRADIHEAFLSVGCALICWQSLRQTWSAA